MQRPTLVLVGATVALGAVIVWRQAGPGRVPERVPPPAPSASASAPLPSAEPAVLPAVSAAPAAPSALPSLPADAPKRVRFGVVIFTHREAEGAPNGARSKEAALEKAEALLEEARLDFKEAVKKGDRGSTADAGSIPRGVLEPVVEYALFTLAKGEVTTPLDTPRGYWIARRND